MTDTHFRLRVSAILETAICELRSVAEEYVTAMEAERANVRDDVEHWERKCEAVLDEVELWKDRYAAEQQAHEADIEAFEREMMHDPS